MKRRWQQDESGGRDHTSETAVSRTNSRAELNAALCSEREVCINLCDGDEGALIGVGEVAAAARTAAALFSASEAPLVLVALDEERREPDDTLLAPTVV